jgi:cytochrome c2
MEEEPAEDEAAEPAEGQEDAASGEEMGEAAAGAASAGAAMQIYKANNCAMCHGKDMGGNKMGPALTGLGANWDAGGLTAYLKNPEDRSVNEEHLAKLDEEYSLTMPAFEGSDEDLKVMVEYLLSK